MFWGEIVTEFSEIILLRSWISSCTLSTCKHAWTQYFLVLSLSLIQADVQQFSSTPTITDGLGNAKAN